jgi:predicted HD phosphohydrolase
VGSVNQQPYAPDAVKLRVWDDQAKIAELQTPDLQHFIPVLVAYLR